MPKLRTELTQEREDELARRGAAARAKLPPPASNETTYPTEGKARAKASRCHLPNTEIGAIQTTHGWVGVVYLRPDQLWLKGKVAEMACRAMLIGEKP